MKPGEFSQEQIREATSEILETFEGDQSFVDQLRELMEEHALEALGPGREELARTVLEQIDMKPSIQGEG